MHKTLAITSLFLAGTGIAHAQAAHPQFSPDGSLLAYFRFDLNAGTARLHVVDIEAGGDQRVETGFAWSVNPSWTP